MRKYVPYSKLSKKKRRAADRQRRGTWGGVNPATHKPLSVKAYNRSKAKRENAREQLE